MYLVFKIVRLLSVMPEMSLSCLMSMEIGYWGCLVGMERNSSEDFLYMAVSVIDSKMMDEQCVLD